MKNSVGIIGGVGPMATVYFMNLIIDMTEASKDQDHINMLVANHATIPDRTDYILGKGEDSPADYMIEDGLMLQNAGCEFLVIPCNTAHFFYKEITAAVGLPVLNIVEETVKLAKKRGTDAGRDIKTIGIMATEGTISTGTYRTYGEPFGVDIVVPDREYQEKVNSIIYDKVKAGFPVSRDEMMLVIDHLRSKGAQAVIMGCTELSIAYRDLDIGKLNEDVVDSLEALAGATVLRCGKEIRQEKK